MLQFHIGFYCFSSFLDRIFVNDVPNPFIVHSRPSFWMSFTFLAFLLLFSIAAFWHWFPVFFLFFWFFGNPFWILSRAIFCWNKFPILASGFFVQMRHFDIDFLFFFKNFLIWLIAALIYSAGYYSAPIFFLLRRINKCFALPHFAAFSTFCVKSFWLL